MKIIKLSAIDSTSSFLKEMAKKSDLENYTVIVAEEQTKGRGQQRNSWLSEPSKNLTMSIFIDDLDLKIYNQKYLNFAISLAVFKTLTTLKIENLSIKWPNDIMSVNKKICGILIENSISSNKIYASIIGIGLNVNQIQFPKSLKNASSLKALTNITYDLDNLLIKLIKEIRSSIKILSLEKYTQLEQQYLAVLYKKNIPTMFKNSEDVLFMGKILGISDSGNLLIELEDDIIKEFGIKEVSLA